MLKVKRFDTSPNIERATRDHLNPFWKKKASRNSSNDEMNVRLSSLLAKECILKETNLIKLYAIKIFTVFFIKSLFVLELLNFNTFLCLKHYTVWLRDRDTKNRDAEVIGKFRNTVLEKNGDDKMASGSNQ